METKQQSTADVAKQVQQTEKLYMENTLLRVAVRCSAMIQNAQRHARMKSNCYQPRARR